MRRNGRTAYTMSTILLALTTACGSDGDGGTAPPPDTLSPGTARAVFTGRPDAPRTGIALARVPAGADGSGGAIAVSVTADGLTDALYVHRRDGRELVGTGSFDIVSPASEDDRAFEAGVLRFLNGALVATCRAVTGTVHLDGTVGEALRGRLEARLTCAAVAAAAPPPLVRVEATFAARLEATLPVPGELRLPVGWWTITEATGRPLPTVVFRYDDATGAALGEVRATSGFITIGLDGRYERTAFGDVRERGQWLGPLRVTDRGRCGIGATGAVSCVSTLHQGWHFSGTVAARVLTLHLDALDTGAPVAFRHVLAEWTP